MNWTILLFTHKIDVNDAFPVIIFERLTSVLLHTGVPSEALDTLSDVETTSTDLLLTFTSTLLSSNFQSYLRRIYFSTSFFISVF